MRGRYLYVNGELKGLGREFGGLEDGGIPLNYPHISPPVSRCCVGTVDDRHEQWKTGFGATAAL